MVDFYVCLGLGARNLLVLGLGVGLGIYPIPKPYT